MTIHVRLFAAAKQQAGCDVLPVELPVGATLADLRHALLAKLPQLSGLLRHTMFAIGIEYAADSTVLTPTADVACIPPVSGG